MAQKKVWITFSIWIIWLIISSIGYGICKNNYFCPNPSFPVATHRGNVESCCTNATQSVPVQSCILNTKDHRYSCNAMESWTIMLYIPIALSAFTMFFFFVLIFLTFVKNYQTKQNAPINMVLTPTRLTETSNDLPI
jgi:hypothetical protein